MENNDKYPLVSFCIFAYNEEIYIEEAIWGAFNQDYPNLEIIISDDCSTDRTYAIAKKCVDAYNGNHKVILNRNNKNLGIREHTNHILYGKAKGEFLIMAGGDDVSMPNRTKDSIAFMLSHPDVMSLSCLSEFIDSEGKSLEDRRIEHISDNHSSIFTLADFVQLPFYIFPGDSRVLRRKVIDAFPPLKYPSAEDIFLFVRSLYLGSIAFLRFPYVKYRRHSESVMSKYYAMKYVSKQDKFHYGMAVMQLKEDLDFAIDQGYIDNFYSVPLKHKIQTLCLFLKPRNKTLLFRAIRKALRTMSKLSLIIESKI